MIRPLAHRAGQISPSPTLSLAAKAKALTAQGQAIVNFASGEPDCDTPEVVKAAAIDAIRNGFTKYTDPTGIPVLKEAVCEKLARENGLTFAPHEILIACGAKHALANIAQVLLEPGDEAIIPAPYWVSYPDQIRLAGATPVVVETTAAEAYRLQPEALRKALTPRTKLVILNSPHNPTGTVYARPYCEALMEVLRAAAVYIVTDEIYEHFVYEGRTHVSFASAAPDLRDRMILVNGVSKTYAMTGWRIGYAAGPAELIRAMGTLQSQSTSNPTSIAQVAAVTALRLGADETTRMVAEFAVRRLELLQGLEAIPGVRCVRPYGTFYVFPDISGLLGRHYQGRPIQTSVDFADVLLEATGVVVVPGEAFGAPGHLRLSYATNLAQIREGLARIGNVVAKLT